MRLSKDKLRKYLNIRREFSESNYININPIQRGGVLSKEARLALLEWGDGYSVCDFCPPKMARLDKITNPPISDFYQDLATFIGMDEARVVTRCREAKLITFMMLREPGGYVILDSLAHYSSYLAAEFAGLRVKEVPNSGYPEFKVNVDAYLSKIEEVIKETGKPPSLALVTHVDHQYGNLVDVTKVAKICHEYGVPVVLNAAYTAGVSPVNGKELGVDVIVSSGHKSWAACAPTGILAMTSEMAKKILRPSSIEGDVTKKRFVVKELALLGCTVMGAPLMTLMASFPYVVERVERWSEEVEKARYVVRELERIDGFRQLGEKPKMHTLIHMESTSFHKVSLKHKRRGFFLHDELKTRGIVGIQPGLTKHFKFNVYGLSWSQIEYLVRSFHEIARKYEVEIK
ncbi:MAG: O-phospho-L-seryl-tRNA:Cys-tRNA synthase [Candidatus Nezhaarchaeota archaeon]|nr:O-phospho-L-seryl-tRNA:Cys-tRNA synthase [Candidatus Nezhaarchaeota archaeon]MCX8141620.1 O-phospho-L-seryl-tRNA:Cys-tRNA synthase [Candidatus Nezhaarchaeota archaeon]MDW8049887.1 O-phospho-L-seryl-tRNA:Cys-tRNA synthase [Nitrososphaerota archaeon]